MNEGDKNYLGKGEGDLSGMGKGTNAFKSRKVFGCDTEGRYKVRPSNTAIRYLLGDDRFAEVILEFPMETRVGYVRE